MLACSSPGGHFKQLVQLVSRIPDVGDVVWLTSDVGLSQDLLASVGRHDDLLIDMPYAAPRDVVNMARDGRIAAQILRERSFDLAISTGAGVAVAVLPLARTHGVRSCYVESATRAEGPSLSGRILARVPGIELYTQNRRYGRRWREAGSVHDSFGPGPQRSVARVRRVVVSLGTIEPYRFDRLVRRLIAILPSDCEVLWQTGATTTERLPIDGRVRVAGPDLEAAMAEADVVVAHAGTGTALTAFEQGRAPVLVPRRAAYGEHVDDHQVVTARDLQARGLATYVEADDLDLDVLLRASRTSVMPLLSPPHFAL